MARQQSSLLALPDPCLLKVLQCCAADDQRSVFSASRVHSRLHQAALTVLRSITAVLTAPLQLDSVLMFLGTYGRQLHSIHLNVKGNGIYKLRQLPPDLQLSSLQLEGFQLQLQPGGGFRGVLGAAAQVAALTKLCFIDCDLLDGDKGLAAALVQLPAGLQHLCINALTSGQRMSSFPTSVLRPLQELTCLKLANVNPTSPDRDSHPLQPLQAMTRLVDLLLALNRVYYVPASVLSGAHGMTSLQVYRVEVDPNVLAGKTLLQHVTLRYPYECGLGLSLRPLLSDLRDLQQLTHLHLSSSLREIEYLPTAAFSALTASSKLQYLNLCCCALPVDVWQHMFPAGRQLPHLTFLDISAVKQPGEALATAPEGSCLVSCCPGLQYLNMKFLRCDADHLAPLRGLSMLHTLRCGTAQFCTGEGLEPVCQLTGLRELEVLCRDTRNIREGLLLQLTQLKQMTKLDYFDKELGRPSVQLVAKNPGDEPVWCQILLYIIKQRL